MTTFCIQICIDVSDFENSHDEVTKYLGLEPFSASTRGVTLRGEKTFARRSIWNFRSVPGEIEPNWTATFEEHWNSIAKKLKGKEPLFKKLAEVANIDLTIIVCRNGRFPSIKIEKELIDFVAQSGIRSIDIDAYD